MSKGTVQDDIFALWINHGSRVNDGRYAYAVLPNADEARVKAFSARPDVELVSNTKDLQAVYHPGLGIGYAVFYSGGSVRLGDVTLTADTPLLMMVYAKDGKAARIAVSDPSRKLLKAHFSVNGTEKHIQLPQGDYAGESITIEL